MKTRSDFVTNSSSSSFIIASKETNPKVTVTLDMTQFVRETIKTVKELNHYYFDYLGLGYGITDENIATEIKKEGERTYTEYMKCLKAIEDGNTVYMIRASYNEGEPFEDFIGSGEWTKGFINGILIGRD